MLSCWVRKGSFEGKIWLTRSKVIVNLSLLSCDWSKLIVLACTIPLAKLLIFLIVRLHLHEDGSVQPSSGDADLQPSRCDRRQEQSAVFYGSDRWSEEEHDHRSDCQITGENLTVTFKPPTIPDVALNIQLRAPCRWWERRRLQKARLFPYIRSIYRQRAPSPATASSSLHRSSSVISSTRPGRVENVSQTEVRGQGFCCVQSLWTAVIKATLSIKLQYCFDGNRK